MVDDARTEPRPAEDRRSRRLTSRRAFLGGAVAALYAATAASWGWPLLARPPIAMFAHHGDLDRWPENTLEALESAMALNPDGIEFDVDRSADGTFWLIHDQRLARTTDGTGWLADLRDDDIRGLTITGGDGFDATRHVGLRMHTLADALDLFETWRGLMMVDLKNVDLQSHRDLMEQLRPRVEPDRTLVIVRSFDGASVVKAADPRFTTVCQKEMSTWHPDVDVWLADAVRLVSWPRTAVADLFGDVCAFVGSGDASRDERPLLENARDRGASMFLTNHLAAALAWRDGATADPG